MAGFPENRKELLGYLALRTGFTKTELLELTAAEMVEWVKYVRAAELGGAGAR